MEAELLKDLELLRDADLAIGVKTKQILTLLEKGYVREQVVLEYEEAGRVLLLRGESRPCEKGAAAQGYEAAVGDC